MYKVRYSLLTLAIFLTITAGSLLYTTANSQTAPTPIITVGLVELIPNQPVTIPITLSEFDQAGLGSVMFTVHYEASQFAPASCVADPDELFELRGCAIHPSEDDVQNEALFTLINGPEIPTSTTTVLGTMVLTPTAAVSGAVGFALEVREFVDLRGDVVVFEVVDGNVREISTATPTPTTTPTETETSNAIPTPTSTLVPTGTDIPMPTSTVTHTSTATPTQTDTPTSTSTVTPTLAPTETDTPTPTSTITATSTPTPSSTATETATTTATQMATMTPTSTQQHLDGTGITSHQIYLPIINR